MPAEAPPGGFRRKLLRGAQFSTLIFLSQIALKLVSITVLTRLLTPDVYGVFAIVLTYLYILQMLSDIGMRSLVLTHDAALDEAFLGTCWTVGLIRGLAIAGISGLIALALTALGARGVFADDSVYAAPELPWALVAVGAVQIFSGLLSPHLYARERDMAFGRVAATEIASSVTGLVVTITAAILLRSVWALVIGTLATTLVKVVMSHLLFHGPALRFRLDRAALRAVLMRGRWIMGHSFLTMAAQSADRLVLGFVLDASGFGFYYIARQFADLAVGFLRSVHSRTGLQLFTHILKARVEDVRRNYYRYRLVFDALAGVGAGAMFVLAPLIVDILFDDRYAGVAPMMRILALALLIVGPLLTRSAFSARREFGRMAGLSLVSAVTVWAGLALGIWIDSLTLALVVIALYRLPEAVILAVMGAREGWVSPAREALPLAFFALGAAAGQGVALAWSTWT